MAVRAFLPGVVVATAAFVVGLVANGLGSGIAAAAGALSVTATFAAYAMTLGWARSVSPTAVQAVALGGWIVRLAVIVGLLFAVRAAGGDVAAFGLAVIAGALAIAVYEARLFLSGLGGDADPASPSPAPDGIGGAA